MEDGSVLIAMEDGSVLIAMTTRYNLVKPKTNKGNIFFAYGAGLQTRHAFAETLAQAKGTKPGDN